MNKVIVVIEYDKPDDPYWMNPDNVKLCLEAYCKNTKFNVSWAKNGDPWEHREHLFGDNIREAVKIIKGK